jgi:hypothetical protein
MEFIFFNENLEGKNKIRKIPKNVEDSTIIQTTKDSVQKFNEKKKKNPKRICGELEQNMRILG